MSCDRRCFDKDDPDFERDDCPTCPGRDDGQGVERQTVDMSNPRERFNHDPIYHGLVITLFECLTSGILSADDVKSALALAERLFKGESI